MLQGCHCFQGDCIESCQTEEFKIKTYTFRIFRLKHCDPHWRHEYDTYRELSLEYHYLTDKMAKIRTEFRYFKGWTTDRYAQLCQLRSVHGKCIDTWQRRIAVKDKMTFHLRFLAAKDPVTMDDREPIFEIEPVDYLTSIKEWLES